MDGGIRNEQRGNHEERHDDFREIQEYMVLAKKENAKETYAKLKKKYIYIKALLNSLGVTLTEIDEIKE